MTVKRSLLSGSLIGSPAMMQLALLVDRRTTKGFDLLDGGTKKAKQYLAWEDWDGLTKDKKAEYWTLKEQHWLYAVIGQKVSICNAFNNVTDDIQQFKTANYIKNLSAITPNIDLDGSIHSWEVTFD
jgi:hypothetical protein